MAGNIRTTNNLERHYFAYEKTGVFAPYPLCSAVLRPYLILVRTLTESYIVV